MADTECDDAREGMTLADIAHASGCTAEQLLATKRPVPRSWPDDFSPAGGGPTFFIPFDEHDLEYACEDLERYMAQHPETMSAPIAMFGPARNGRFFLLGQVRTHDS